MSQKLDFNKFKTPIANQFGRISKGELFCVDVDRDEIWDKYLASFPEGTNPMYRQRTEYDCSCCRSFVKTMGSVVTVDDKGNVTSIWDTKFDEPAFQAVADAMSTLVKSKPIDRPFMHYEPRVGTDKNREDQGPDKPLITWHHFYVDLPTRRNRGSEIVVPNPLIPTKIGNIKTTHDVFLRSLTEITRDSVDTVLDLIKDGSLYRGDEFKKQVEQFLRVQKSYFATPEANRSGWVWVNSTSENTVARIRNTAIGTLLTNLSQEMDLEHAVGQWEKIMAPTNYKRPTALVSKRQVEDAKVALTEMGLIDALDRRYAKFYDISINDILFADAGARKAMNADIFDEVQTKGVQPKMFDKVQEIAIDKFISDVIPRAESIEVMFENRHEPNLVSLVAPMHVTSKEMFKWRNRFSWSYNGGVTDSIKERVKRAGGQVEADLCFRLAWYNTDDLDLHMNEAGGYHIYYGSKGPSPMGGQLDVDMNAGQLVTDPVENIFYKHTNRMRPGIYTLSVNQFSQRNTSNVGFEVDMEFNGKITKFVYDKAVKGTIRVCKFEVDKNQEIKIVESLPSTETPKEIWKLRTMDFHRVTTVMRSPNHWEDAGAVGNMHTFFMIDGCQGSEARGFYNEFLRADLDKHRKVIEILGGKASLPVTPDQLSGLGFSSTQRNELLARVKGSFNRTLRVHF